MDATTVSLLAAVALSAITVLADTLIKDASMKDSFTGLNLLIAGSIIYGLTAFGWFFVMRKVKLSTLGAVYAVSCILLLAFVSVFWFKEKITGIEILGIALAIASLVILFRFA